MGMRRSAWVIGGFALIGGLGCGAGDNQLAARGPASASGQYRGSGTVLESPDHGPQLCDAVAESYPPQCSGLEVVGWDWAAVDGEESARGTTWGTYEVTGTWDGERLTLTAPAGAPEPQPPEDVDFSTPCPEPAGGWAVVDPATTNQASLSAVSGVARTLPGFAGLWVDQPIRGSQATNDPTNLVVNVRVSGDIGAAERDLRALWGGALCVSAAELSYAELAAIQTEIDSTAETIGMVRSNVDEVNGTVEVEAVVADAGLEDGYDSRYGPGTVVVTGWLQPVN
jgi:hypothetical protein